jgi:hypothetical protein
VLVRNNPVLPAYRLAIFEETDEQRAERERAENVQREKDAERQRQADVDAQRQRDSDAAARKKSDDDAAAAAAKKKADDDAAAAALRNGRGQFESREEYEARIKTLNDENADRRRENKELKGTVTVLERRTIIADVRETIAKASPLNDAFSKAAITLFLQEHESDLKIDPKTGDTVGLDKFATWKKANPDFFKAEETAEQKATREKAEQKAIDDAKRGNRSSGGPSRGSGAGSENGNTDGLPDLTTLDPAARKKALDDYRRGLRAGGGSGYAKASSRR